jgi:PKD repeat protein/predicted nucleotidyltransferase
MKKLHLLTFLFFQIISLNLFSQQFTEQTDISIAGVSQGSVAWGDYDNDGYLDFILSGWSDSGPVTKIYHNNGDNTFTEQTGISIIGVFLGSVAWGDYDNDGYLDILITGTTTGLSSDAISKIYRNDNGNFTEIAIGLPGVYLSSVAWGDYDNDGNLDILLTGLSESAERISKIYRNNGNGNFVEVPGTSFTGVCYGSAAWGDYDNDGYLDILLTGQTTSINRISKIYRNNGDGSFTEQTNILLKGVSYSSVAWADYNNDGYLDILLTGEDVNFTNIIKIYQNNGKNNFFEQTGISLTGAKNGSIAWGDYNNDGNLDILMTGNIGLTPVSKIYLNNGDNSFTEQTGIAFTGVGYSSTAWGDYDNDGDLDILLTGQDSIGNLISKIYLNNCEKINKNPDQPKNLGYEIQNTKALLRWNRINKDETASKSITYNVRVGRTSGACDFVSSHSASNGFRRIATMGNCQLDTTFILNYLRWDTTYYASVQAVDNSYKGGLFSDEVQFKITPIQPSSLTASNISTTSLLLKWKRGNGDRCILFAKEGTSGPSSPVNNTTYFANPVFGEGSPLGTTGWFCIYKGEADSVMISGLDPQKDYTIHAIEFQGPNGSELYASATNENNDNIGVFSSGLFTNLSGISMVGLRRSSVAWGDYDNDGYMDILLTGENLSSNGVTKIYRSNGDNSFSDQIGISLPGVYWGSVAWGDYNNDDLLDILITGYNNDLGPIAKVYKNNGNNSFVEQTDISLTGVYNSSVAWGDYDNDGYLDIIITGYNTDIGPVSKIYRNNGDNTFTEQTGISLTGVYNGSVAWGDYDNDGDLDILIAGLDASGNPVSKIYKNNGNNSFTEQSGISLMGAGYSSVAWGDYDNDGNLDILLVGSSGSFPNYNPISKIYHNNGNNTFTEETGTSLTGIYNGSVSWGDYNNDGLLDILLIGDSGSNYVFKIYLNNGNHKFIDQTFIQLPGAIACSASSADYDNDGDLDILISGYTGALSSKIYRNNLYMKAGRIKSNMRPNAPTGLASEITPGIVKLSWNSVTNDETSPINMSYNLKCKLKNEPNWKIAPEALANGNRSLINLGNTQLNRNYIIKNPASGIYYWQVQAIDQSFSGSVWSGLDSVTIKNTQAFFKTDTVCKGLLTNFTDQSVVFDGIASWKWDFNDGSASTLQNPVHLYLLSGIYNVKLVVTSKAGDKDSLLQNVIVKAVPLASFTAPNVCLGTPTAITNTSGLNGLTSSGWMWTFGDGLISTLQQPGTHTFPIKGTYRTKLQAMTTNGCADSITKDVIIAGYPGSSVSIDGKLSFCQGQSVQLSADYDPLYTYQWKMDNNNLTNADSSNYQVKLFSGTYSATVTNTMANCVTNTEQKTVTINPNPFKPVIDSSNYQRGKCPGVDPIKLNADQIVSGYNYQWMRNGVIISDAISPYLSVFSQGAYTLIAKLDKCTTTSDILNISFLDAPPKPVIYSNGPNVWYLVCSDTSAAKYIWYYNGKQIIGADNYLYLANRNYGQYWVTIANDKGCYNASDPVTIPTGITGIENVDPFANLKIYPNPGQGLFTVEMDNNLFGDLYISALDQNGKEILKTKLEKTTEFFSCQMDLSRRPKGICFITMSLKGFSINNKIIIQ